MSATNTTNAATPNDHKSASLKTLIIGAIGVVYGDIGTSPLYAFKETFAGSHPLALTDIHILNVLSLIFWAVTIVVTFKYVALMLRADNKGEGGSLSLLALASRISHDNKFLMAIIPILGLFAASLFYGDSIITPAISVLSAVEGLKVVAPTFEHMIIPITLGIIISLFAVQKYGTAKMGQYFGPLTALWFITIGALGLVAIINNPAVLVALNPMYAIEFFMVDKFLAFLTIGTVVLALTGAEALYADLGHFGKKPIRIAWLWFVFPALILNYFGQGAYVMANNYAVENPFFMMAPKWMEWPLFFLATAATIIASQAVITGAFSVTRQAIQLGYLPRMTVIHTSAQEIGQIYLPFINWMLLLFVILLVIGFQSSTNLAHAYGVAVTGTMLIDTVLLGIVAVLMWKWKPYISIPVIGGLFIIDLALFSSTAMKIPYGGWFPLAFGLVIFVLLTTWKTGRNLVLSHVKQDAMPVDIFFRDLCPTIGRVNGTAIFMSNLDEGIPIALQHNLKHNKILHERNILIHVSVLEKPYVKAENRYTIQDLGQGFFRVAMNYGFKDEINVPKDLANETNHGFVLDMDKTSFFIGRETVIPTNIPGMSLWREFVFAFMNRNASSAADFYRLPSKRTMELGSRIDI
jgi:KUP system potassium uptake protein